MQTLYGIFINNVGQVSVDVFNPKRASHIKWRSYFCVSSASIARLRRVYAAHKKACMISREWSPARWRVYREWRATWALDVIPTSGGSVPLSLSQQVLHGEK